MKKKIMLFIMAITLTLSMGAYARSTETITESGSSALLPIVKQAASDFMASHQDVNVQTAGGGSGTGLQQVTNGIVNIGSSDVYAPEGSGLVDHQVAVEPFLFVVNSDVLIASLTTQQIIDIFSGKITNWKDVGGKNEKITVIMRAASSGTRMTIQALVMKDKQFTTNGVVQDSAGSVRTTVMRTPGSIGYVDLSYVSPLTRTVKYNGVAPTIENVINGTYPLIAYGHMYTKGEATGNTKAFIDYIQSKTFQDKTLPAFKFVSPNDMGKAKVQKITDNTKKAAPKKK